MLTRKMVENAPDGITYLTLGILKEHMLELATSLEAILSGTSDELTDEEFRSWATNTIKDQGRMIEELYEGMNYLGDAMKKNGIQI